MKKLNLVSLLLLGLLSLQYNCSEKSNSDPDPTPTPAPNPTPNPTGAAVRVWMTKADGSMLLEQQATDLVMSSPANSFSNLDVDSAQRFQTVDGFGYTLTGSSAYLLNRMSAAARASLLQELFSTTGNGIGVSYLRLSIGASDLSPEVFSYNDLPAGQTDPTLTRFSLSKDTTDLIPVLKEILAINPSIKLMGSPWSPPTWMKTNNNSIGGGLLPQYYSVYAQYFVKYIQAMKARGITIDAITVQNEPQHDGNNPSLKMSATEQADFIKNHLGPAFQTAGITTKIIIWDHNCDNPQYPITVLNDAAAAQYIDGSAFHLYAGDISALSTVKSTHPAKNLYFTEQWTGSTGSFSGDLQWHVKNVIIGSMRNWSKIALEWNLANDPSFGPHTPGGCTQCKGALTINGDAASRNVGYYIIAHASKFIPAGSVRVSSTTGALPNAAFVTPSGQKVVVAVNETGAAINFNIRLSGKWAVATLPANAVATYTWN